MSRLQETTLGNFEPVEARFSTQSESKKHARSVLRGSVGEKGENIPSDLRLVGIALKEAGLLAPGTSPDSLKKVIIKTVKHVNRAKVLKNNTTLVESRIKPAGQNERRMRRALSELRYPAAHQGIIHSAAPKGVREALNEGIRTARSKIKTALESRGTETSPGIRRAVLPSISLQAFQANRRIAETLTRHSLDGLSNLIAESIRLNGKQGYVEVRDFFSILKKKSPTQANDLFAKAQSRLRGKPRRRFIKLGQDVPPTEGDFDD